jgi:hypothetical protein
MAGNHSPCLILLDASAIVGAAVRRDESTGGKHGRGGGEHKTLASRREIIKAATGLAAGTAALTLPGGGAGRR